MNYITKSEDNLESLPSRERLKHGGERRSYRDLDFPWRHFIRFLEANVGKNIDKVIHDFVNCDWCPSRFRTASKVAESVEMHTYLKNGKVYFHDSRQHRFFNTFERCVDQEPMNRWTPFFYVHPDNRTLQVSKRRDIKAKRVEDPNVRVLGNYHQFCKYNGTWYEVKAETCVTSFTYKGPRDILLSDKIDDVYSRYGKPGIRITLKRQLNS